MNMPKSPYPPYLVQFPKSLGRGVFVGDVIITAAHCIAFSTNGEMVLSTLGAAWTVCGSARALSANRNKNERS